MKINYFVTHNSATLYWDKPLDANETTSYKILLDGKPLGETKKTHYTVKSLTPSTKFNVKIESDIAIGESEFTTNAEKCKLDVTQSETVQR